MGEEEVFFFLTSLRQIAPEERPLRPCPQRCPLGPHTPTFRASPNSDPGAGGHAATPK